MGCTDSKPSGKVVAGSGSDATAEGRATATPEPLQIPPPSPKSPKTPKSAKTLPTTPTGGRNSLNGTPPRVEPKALKKRGAPPAISIPSRVASQSEKIKTPTASSPRTPLLPGYMTLERSDSISSIGSREDEVALNLARKRAVRHRRVDVFSAAPQDLQSSGPIVIPKSDEVRTLLQDALKLHFLFANLGTKQMDEIIDAFGPEAAGTGEDIVTEGANGDRFYVVEEGTVEVLKEGEVLAELGAQSHFGELALLYNCPRTASVRASAPCKLWSVDSVTFKRIVCCHAAQEITELVAFLQRVSMLQALTPNQYLQLAESLHPANYEEGEIILQQGDPGEMFFLLKEGEVMVTQVAEDGKVWELAHLHAGEFFGERALLNTDVRSATVTATMECKCLVLDRTDFVAMLGPLQTLMEHQHGERLRTPASPFSGLRRSAFNDRAAAAMSGNVSMDDLEVLAPLGQGAFGLVSLVKHRESGQAFALKAMNKAKIVEARQTQGVLSERRILGQLQHPLILQLVGTFQDSNRLYCLLEFLQGGDLFSLMMREGGLFSIPHAKFYIGTVISVFEMLHRKDILYRDLKPENLVLDSRGFCKMVDFGFAKETQDRTYTFCGTPEYLAPEIIANKGHGKGVDCWALGVLAFELVSGFSPFCSSSGDQMEIYKRIMKVQFEFPRHVVDEELKDLVRRCFVKNPSKRLGCLKNGMLDIKKHRWMRGFDWVALHAMTMEPPFVPDLRDPFDSSCFEAFTAASRHDKPYTGDQAWCEEF